MTAAALFQPAADVLLVTVAEAMTRAVFAALRVAEGHEATLHHHDAKSYYHLGCIAGAQTWLVQAELGTAIPGGALPTISSAIATLRPHAIILVETAFGLDATTQRNGDLLIAKQLMLYEHRKLGTGATGELRVIPRGDRPSASTMLLDRFNHGALTWPQRRRVRFGLLLSGDSHIDHADACAALQQLEPEALGGEWAGAGLYLAASAAKVDWIVVAALGAWADGRPRRNAIVQQQRAARHAAEFTLHVLRQGGLVPANRRMATSGLGDAAAILQQMRAILRPTPIPYRATVTRMVEDYTAVFGGRAVELARLDEWLRQDSRPFAFLHAPTGRGKTALLLHWAAHIQAQQDWTVVLVPISLRYQTATDLSMLGALGAALAAFHRDTAFSSYNQAPDQLRPLIADYLRREPPAGQRLLLVLDGLDEAIGWQVSRELFPRTPGTHLRVLASARQKAQMTRDDWYAQLGWRGPLVCELGLAGLSQAAVSDVLRRMGNPLDALATDVDLLGELARVSDGDPLTIRFLVEALADRTLTPGRLVRMAPGLEAYVKDWLGELRRYSAQADTIYALLGLCATALGPLTAEDLAALDPARLGRGVVVQQAAAAVERFLIGDGSVEQGYVFSHPRLRELFLERLLQARERAELLARFVAYGTAWYAERSPPLPDYLRLFWVAHLRAAGAWAQLRQVLTEVDPNGTAWLQPWQHARYAVEGSYTGYLSDLDTLWTHSAQQDDVSTELRCALIVSTLRSLSGNLTPELLVALVTIGTPAGRWSVQAALEHIAHMPIPWQRRRAFQVLVQAAVLLPVHDVLAMAEAEPDAETWTALWTWVAGQLTDAERSDAVARALRAAQSQPDAAERALRLTTLANYVDVGTRSGVMAQALAAVRDVSEHWRRVTVLIMLVGWVGVEARAEVLRLALGAVQEEPEADRRAELFVDLVGQVTEEMQAGVLRLALGAVQEGPDAIRRAELLTALVELVGAEARTEMVARVLAVVQSVSDGGLRAALLTALIGQVEEGVRVGIVAEALAAAQVVPDPARRVGLLTRLVGQVGVEAQADLVTQALAAQAELQDWRRAALLTRLAEQVGVEARADLVTQALAAAQVEPDAGERARALVRLVELVGTDAQAAVVAAALAAAQAVPDTDWRAKVLNRLVGQVGIDAQAAVVAEARAAAQMVPDAGRRAALLTRLVGQVGMDAQAEVIAEARAVVQAMPDVRRQAEMLIRLLGHVGSDAQAGMIAEAQAAAQAVPDARQRAELLTALAGRTRAARARIVAQALAAAQAVSDVGQRAELLTALVGCARAARVGVVAQALAAAQAVPDARRRAELLTVLAGHTRAARAGIVAQALAAAQAVPDAGERAERLTALVKLVDAPVQAAVLTQALAAAQMVPGADWRAELLTGLVGQVDAVMRVGLVEQVLSVVPEVPEGWRRAELLIGLVGQVDAVMRVGLVEQVLALMQVEMAVWVDAEVWTDLAPHLVQHATCADWHTTIRNLAACGRPAFLRSLAALMPWLVAQTTPEQRAELAQAITDVCRCWP